MDIQQNNVAILHFNLVNQDGSTIFIRKTKLATFNLINPSAVSVPITDIGFDATLNQCWVRVPKESNATTGRYYGVLNIVDDDWGTYTTSKIKVYSVVSDADEDTKSVVFTATCIATQVTNPSGGNSPYYNTTTGTWWQYSDTLQAFEDTGVGNLIQYTTFKGVATPETTPGTPDGNVYYIAYSPGNYPNFNINVPEGTIGTITKKGTGWLFTDLKAATLKSIMEIKSEIDLGATSTNIANMAIQSRNTSIYCNFFQLRNLWGIEINAPIGTIELYVLNVVTGVATLYKTLTQTTAGVQRYLFDSVLSLGANEYLGTKGIVYYSSSNENKAIKQVGFYEKKIDNTISFVANIELGYNLIGSSLKDIVLNNDAVIRNNTNSISTITSTLLNDGNLPLYTETAISSSDSDYTNALENVFPTSGSQWFSEQNKVTTATNLVSVKTKVSSIGPVIVYDFDPVAKTVTAIGTFNAATTGWQTFVLVSPVVIAAGHYVGCSNTTFKTGGAGAQKLTVSGGVVSSFKSDIVELCQNIKISTNIAVKGLVSINTELESINEKLNPVDSNNYIQLFKDVFSTQDSSNWTYAGTWTTESNGVKPSAIGNTTYLLSKRIYHSDKRFMRMRVLMGIDTKLMIPVVWGGTINGGEGASCFAVDFSGKKLIIYSVGAEDNQPTASGYTSTELNTTVIPDNVIGAREYIIELHKDGTNHILRLLDTLTGEKIEVSHNGWAAGRQNQYYGFFVDSGTLPTIMNMEVWSLNKPDVVFAGDSITEGVMVVDRTRRYAEQFRTNNPLKKVVISARGGDTIDGILAKFATEYNIYRPKKLSVLIGANGGNTLAKLQQLKSNCDAINCTLILNYRTCQYGTNVHIDGNNLIAQIGVNGARFDIATALNNNPIGATDGSDSRYNPALYYGTGGLHPNNDGDDKMYNRLIVDVPEMYYL